MRFNNLTIILVTFFCLAANNCCVSSDAGAISKGLRKLEKTIPLPYHESLVRGVKYYELKSLPGPFIENESFFETELLRRNMPIELKYLPVSLTDMRLDYESCDCRGVWALPTLVAFQYGLTVDEDTDERLLVEPSTIVALDYLLELYQQYGDWWMSILAFSSSPNALQHAIVKSEKFLELWDFFDQDLLANSIVIRNFIACNYVYSAYTPEQKASALASFKEVKVKRLSEEKARKTQEAQVAKSEPMPKSEPKVEKPAKSNESYTTYTVKKGDTLIKIARKYHVSVSNIKKWNKLKNDFIREGQKLKIKK